MRFPLIVSLFLCFIPQSKTLEPKMCPPGETNSSQYCISPPRDSSNAVELVSHRQEPLEHVENTSGFLTN